MAYGTALASFNVEAFGTERMQTLTADEVNERVAELQRVTVFDASPVALLDATRRLFAAALDGVPSARWAGRCSTCSCS